MSDRQKSLNDTAWEELFEKHDILKERDNFKSLQNRSKRFESLV